MGRVLRAPKPQSGLRGASSRFQAIEMPDFDCDTLGLATLRTAVSVGQSHSLIPPHEVKRAISPGMVPTNRPREHGRRCSLNEQSARGITEVCTTRTGAACPARMTRGPNSRIAGTSLNDTISRSGRFGRGWDRTSDLPRVNGAQMGRVGH